MTPSTSIETLAQSVGRLEGKIDMALALLAKQDEGHERLTDRVTKVERRQFVSMGGAGVIGSLFTLAIAILGVLPK